MISRKYRFQGHASLKYVFKHGRSERSKFFVVKYLENPHRPLPRVAVVIGRKVHKSAVKRNRIRRRIYEIIRPFLRQAPPIDICISVYSPEPLTAPKNELLVQLLPIFKKIGLS